MTHHRARRLVAAMTMAVALGASVSACSSNDGAPAGDEAAPAVDLTSAPAKTTWVQGPVGLSYPVSAVAGPHVTDGVPHGFDPSPQGAVVAAIIAQVFMSGADDDQWPAVSQTLLEPGPGRDQWAQARALMSVGTEPLANPPVFRGFRISEYSENKAIVTLAASYPNGILAALPVQLSRASGDWRVVLPTQEEAPDLQEIENLDGFTPFGPQ